MTSGWTPQSPPPGSPISSPGLEVLDGLLHALLVVADHVLVHVGVVGADVLLRAAVGHRAEAQRRVLLCRLLELGEERKRVESAPGDRAAGVDRLPSYRTALTRCQCTPPGS